MSLRKFNRGSPHSLGRSDERARRIDSVVRAPNWDQHAAGLISMNRSALLLGMILISGCSTTCLEKMFVYQAAICNANGGIWMSSTESVINSRKDNLAMGTCYKPDKPEKDGEILDVHYPQLDIDSPMPPDAAVG